MKINIIDGGIRANCTCKCGYTMRVSVWGLVYCRSKKGQVIKLRDNKITNNFKKCKCGKIYIFVPLPDIAWKVFTKKEWKKIKGRK